MSEPARHSSLGDDVLVQFYLVRADAIGTELKDALVTKATERVRVFVLYDEIGRYGLPSSYVRELRAGGVRVSIRRGQVVHG